MALIVNPLFITLTLSLFFSLSLLPHANATSSEFSTTILNVTAALHQARQVLSSHHQHPEEDLTFSTSSSFTLQLHPRESLFNAADRHKDYRSLVLARLSRDSARVSWILSKLQHGNKSELRPEDLSSPVTSGVSEGSAEYFTRIQVGQPAQSFSMILDTGSDVNWLQCKPCYNCYNQTDPIFDPSTSSSYAPIPCEAKQCKELDVNSCSKDRYCEYEVMYGDGSLSAGVFATETVSLGSTGLINRVPMGCGNTNQGLFVGAAGILGLGLGPLSFTSRINASSFSYCLVYRDTNGSSTLEFNSPRPGDSVTAQLLKNPKLDVFYYVRLTGISVGGRTVRVPPSTFTIQPSGLGGIIVDSGTAITRLEHQAYYAVRNAFRARTRHLRRARAFSLLDTCYDLSSVTAVTLPTVSFEMSDGRSWSLPVLGFMLPVDDNGTFCFAFAPSVLPLSIIGNVQQQGTRVTYDLANSVVGFSPGKC